MSPKLIKLIFLLIFIISVNCDSSSIITSPTTDETSPTNKDDYLSINTEEVYEINDNKGNVLVKKSDCLPEKPITVRQKRQTGVPGGVSPTRPEDSEHIENLVKDSLTKLNGDATGHSYSFSRVISSTKQVVSGMSYKIKAEFIHHEDATNVDSTVECDISIWDQPWKENGRKVEYTCPNYEPYAFRQRRSIDENSADIIYEDENSTEKDKDVLVGAPQPVSSEDNDDIKMLLDTSIAGVNGVAMDSNYELVKIINSTRQIVSGVLYNVLAEFNHRNVTNNDNSTVLCNVEIWDQPWLENGRDVNYTCNNAKQYNFRQKRSAEIDRSKLTSNSLGAPSTTNTKEQKKIKQVIKEALVSFNSQNENNNYRLSKIMNTTRQTVSGILYKVKAEFILGDTDETVICNVQIYERPWESVDNYREVEFHCDNEEKHTVRAKRSASDDPQYLSVQQLRDDLLDEAMEQEQTDSSIFLLYKNLYNKSYKTTLEHNMRFRIFKTNLRKIRQLNSSEQGSATYGISEFADLTTSEYQLRTGLLTKPENSNHIPNPIAEIPDFKLPREFDWRTKGAVSHVKNQGNCGSCWAFSVIGNVEGLHAVKTGTLEEYSEQELLDCDDIDKGCNGGLPDDAYKAIEQIGGLELESEYPYKAKQSKCEYNSEKSHVQLKGAVDLPKNETAMALWLLQNGPISIGINANAMQFYRAGVSHPWKVLCNHDNLDHGVLIVGFGIHDYPRFKKSLPYWIVKNSWGPSWGEKGYYRVYRGDNTCGVANMATSAVLE